MSDTPPEFLNTSPTAGTEISANPAVTFQGNNYDLAALVGVTIGGVTLLSCFTFGMGIYCLPFLPLILGLIGLTTAKDSINPERTKLLSWISLGIGGVILLLILALVVVYIAIIVLAINSDVRDF